jgi:hypothetical protein
MTTNPSLGSTATTVDFLTMLYNRLVGYRGPTGKTLSSALADATGTVKLYQVRAPDHTPFPYATMRLISTRTGEHKGLRVQGQLEVLLYGRPWSQLADMEALADLIDEAMLFFRRSNDGLTFAQGSTRTTLPPAPSPADSEIVTIRLVYNVAYWPKYLTRISTF